MKKSIIVLLTAALFTFTGASPWEGTAVVAPEGELPSTGFYVATNSFPRNTVVEITNIETDRSTRAIVANRLENPDLLAIVSREAAELIGMRAGSITNIRMVQPAEPSAFSRFTEDVSSGAFYYDLDELLSDELYRDDRYKPPVTGSEPEPIPFETTPPQYTLEPEWRTRDIIVDLPFDYNPPAVENPPVTENPPVMENPPAENAEEPIETVQAPPEEEIIEEIGESEESEEIAEAEEETQEEIEELAEETVESPAEMVLVPAEERPPESLYGINPADIIPGIKLPEPEWKPEERTQENPNDINIVEVIPGIKFPEPEWSPESITDQPPSQPAADAAFSVPRITELERNRYYVQVAAFESPQSIEDALKQIDRNYQPVVYKDGDVWYRILLGPLNQGESAAILQRFRSIGYNDAFVRHVVR